MLTTLIRYGLCFAVSSVLVEMAFAGSSAGELKCRKGGISLEGIVPGDSIEIDLRVKNGAKAVVLQDDLTSRALAASGKKDTAAPKAIVAEVSAKSATPQDGPYFLEVTKPGGGLVLLQVRATAKPAKKTVRAQTTEYRFQADIDLMLPELANSQLNIKTADCHWLYHEP